MLIVLAGARCAGKAEVATFLKEQHGFSVIDTATLHKFTEDSQLDATPTPILSKIFSQCWRADVNVVIVNAQPILSALRYFFKRPYFLLVFVDAPLLMRFERAVSRGATARADLHQFVKEDDTLKFGRPSHRTVPRESAAPDQVPSPTLTELASMSHVTVTNDYASLEQLRDALCSINLTDVERLRPSWDSYFMSLAMLAARRTNCMKRAVGCVLALDRRMIASGYNGTPTGLTNCFNGGCPRCNGTSCPNGGAQGIGLDLCLCLHAEENAIIEAGRERCRGSTLYTTLFPCVLCAKKIVQAGIVRVVFDSHYAMDETSEMLLKAGGVTFDRLPQSEPSPMGPET